MKEWNHLTNPIDDLLDLGIILDELKPVEQAYRLLSSAGDGCEGMEPFDKAQRRPFGAGNHPVL